MNSIVKIIPIFCSFLFMLLYTPLIHAQSSSTATGLDGDHFSLEGALDLFKNADSPEQFENLLNAANNDVNNLDLNEDGQVDYIRIEDHQEGEVHSIVLQVAVSESEVQDIAVIEIEKTGENEAILQILGDENLYGESIIVEPYEVSVQTNPTGNGGPSPDLITTRIIVNVWGWSPVRFIYRPIYRPYVSPYRWRTFPRYYQPWAPRSRSIFRSAIIPRPHCRVVTTHRVLRAHNVYTPRRRSSVIVHQRTTTRIAARPNNNRGTAAKRTTTTRANNSNGNVRTHKTTTTTRNNRGNTANQRTSTTRAKNSNGNVGARKTTTTTTRNKKGNTVKKKTTTTKVRRKK